MAEPDQVRKLAWAFSSSFALMCGYYVLRAVRDEMGAASGAASLRWLFVATLVGTLAAVPLFGHAASRLPRASLLAAVHAIFLGAVAAFYALLKAGVPGAAPAFFTWLSVANLVVVSAFWSCAADVFDAEEGRRLFGGIASGGTAGAIAGPALAAVLARQVGPVDLVPIAAALFLAAAVATRRFAGAGGPALGGRALAGVGLTLRSPYLCGICVFTALYAALTAMLYVERASLVAADTADPGTRTAFFASVDLAANTLALLMQAFATRRAVERLGLAVTLAMVPALVALACLGLAAVPALAPLAAVMVLHRAGDYALLRPGREMLFTAAGRAARYKAKNVVDTVVYRGGDAAGAWLVAAIRAAGLELAGVATAAAALAVVWAATGYAIGRMYERHDHDISWTDLTPRGAAPARRRGSRALL